MPCFRDPDNLVYGKAEAGGILFGGYEPDPRRPLGRRRAVGTRRAFARPPDLDRFEQLMRGAARRFPFVADAEIVKLVCHPDAMTPDANPLLGPMPGVRGFFMAAGLSLNGFGGAGGIGKAIAEWVTAGETELDVLAYRAWRFGTAYRDPRGRPRWRARRIATTTSCATRSIRTSGGDRSARAPLMSRLQDAGRGLRREERLGTARIRDARRAVAARRAPISARGDGASRRSWLASPRSTAPSASG